MCGEAAAGLHGTQKLRLQAGAATAAVGVNATALQQYSEQKHQVDMHGVLKLHGAYGAAGAGKGGREGQGRAADAAGNGREGRQVRQGAGKGGRCGRCGHSKQHANCSRSRGYGGGSSSSGVCFRKAQQPAALSV
jgi:hypothetical protein